MKVLELDKDKLHPEFTDFYKENFNKIKVALLFMGVDGDSASDIAQESFTKIWLSWNQFETNAARMGFMKIVSKNLWIDKCRKLKHESIFRSEWKEYKDEALDALHYKELLRATQMALAPFDEDYQKIYYEIKLNGCSYKEVSERFQINIKTLERHMTKMSKTVRIYLQKYYAHLSVLAAFFNI